MKKRIVSLFMALVMTLSLLPTTAWAVQPSPAITEQTLTEQTAEEPSAADAVEDIQQDIMQHLDAMEAPGTAPAAASAAPAAATEPEVPGDFKLSLDELKFGRNYTGE